MLISSITYAEAGWLFEGIILFALFFSEGKVVYKKKNPNELYY